MRTFIILIITNYNILAGIAKHFGNSAHKTKIFTKVGGRVIQ